MLCCLPPYNITYVTTSNGVSPPSTTSAPVSAPLPLPSRYRYHLRTPDQVDSAKPYSSRFCKNHCEDKDDIGPTNWKYV
jgi:hypothetical protein